MSFAVPQAYSLLAWISKRSLSGAVLAALILVGGMRSAHGGLIVETFNSLGHGQIVDNEFAAHFTVSGDNFSRPSAQDLIVSFDTFETNTRDPDLQDPFDLGNAATSTVFRDLQDPRPGQSGSSISRFYNALIIEENGIEDTNNPGFIDRKPDDEGSRPAGEIQFDFVNPINEFGFDLLDVEGKVEAYEITFSLGGAAPVMVSFADFVTSGSIYYDDTIEFGNNSANRIRPITAADLQVENFDRVVIKLGGSGAVDNIAYSFTDDTPNSDPVPEPTTLGIWAVLAVATCFPGRRQRRPQH